jgi:hypothetical protein
MTETQGWIIAVEVGFIAFYALILIFKALAGRPS